MADAYWRYADARHQAAAQAAAQAAVVVPTPQPALKRPRSDYPDMPGGSEMLGYYTHDEERTAYRVIRDTETVEASYDRYLRNGISSYGTGEPVRPVAGGITARPVDDRRVMGVAGMDRSGYGGGRMEPPLPPDASNTLFVEGLPSDCMRREVSHIFRPFVGFQEVRLVTKDSRHPGQDPLVLCFVDFVTPAQAAVALEALQGYKFDENDRESSNLRLQFARFPPRSSGGHRGRR